MAKSRSKKNKDKEVNSTVSKTFAKVTRKAFNTSVQVVECPPDFPYQLSNNKKKTNAVFEGGSTHDDRSRSKIESRSSNIDKQQISHGDFNFSNASEEIYKLGMNTGRAEKKRLKEKEYKLLTGREMKKKGLPFREYLKSLSENRKMEREQMKDIKSSGVVIGKSTSNITSSSNDRRKGKKPSYSVESKRNNKLFGPAPSIGYMKGGILRVKKT